MIRLLRRYGAPKGRRKLPRQQHPDRIAQDYRAALVRWLRETVHVDVTEIVRLHVMQRRAEGKLDSDEMDEALRLIDDAERRYRLVTHGAGLEFTVRTYGQRVLRFQAEQLDKQLTAGLGVPLSALDKPVRESLDLFIERNVDLIKTVPERYFERLRQDVREAFESGMHSSTLAERLEERDGMAEYDATRIARDQVGKLAAEANEVRQKSLGITGYIWRTVHDSRVRDEHAHYDGQHYEWNAPPPDGHPGDAVMCRCYAEPDLGPILDSL